MTAMDCPDARARLLDLVRGRLSAALAAEVRAHVDACVACAHAAEAESVLDEVLERRLPQHPASHALKRRLRAQWPPPAEAPAARPWRARLAWAVALSLVLLVAAPVGWDHLVRRPDREAADRLVSEAVNDHLRVLFSEHPLEVRDGGIHQVRPWFAGRLDFAPVVRFAGDAEFPLQGGAIGYFVDRKAAIVVYHRGLHVISLVVFRAEHLPWPQDHTEPIAGVLTRLDSARGFNVLLWREGTLGYALVSDVDAASLRQLAGRLITGS